MRHALRLTLAAAVGTAASFLVPVPAWAGGGCHKIFDDGPVEDRAGDTIEMGGMCMNPTVLRVEPGDQVTIVNADPMVHNAIGARVSVDALGIGESATLRFDEPGVYPYSCTLHPGMVGAVVVSDAVAPASAVGSGVSPTVEPAETRSPPVSAVAVVLAVVAVAIAAGGATLTTAARRRRRPGPLVAG